MAMDKQRKTSDLANVVVTDASNNVTLPNNLLLPVIGASDVLKTDVSGQITAGSISDFVVNTGDVWASTAKITNIVTLTQAEYDAIVSPSSNYLYVII